MCGLAVVPSLRGLFVLKTSLRVCDEQSPLAVIHEVRHQGRIDQIYRPIM